MQNNATKINTPVISAKIFDAIRRNKAYNKKYPSIQ